MSSQVMCVAEQLVKMTLKLSLMFYEHELPEYKWFHPMNSSVILDFNFDSKNSPWYIFRYFQTLYACRTFENELI